MNIKSLFPFVTKKVMLQQIEKAVRESRLEEPPFASITGGSPQWNSRPGPTKEDMLKASCYSGWFYACLRRIAQVVAQLPYKFVLGDKKIEKTKAGELFKYPHRKLMITWYDLIELTCFSLDSCGEAFWLMCKPKEGKPSETINAIRVLRADKMTPVINPEEGVVEWRFGLYNFSSPIVYPAKAVVHFYYCNPLSDFEGLSPAVPGWDSLQADGAIRRLNRVLVENDFELGAVLKAAKDVEVTPQQIARLLSDLRMRHAGPDKVGRGFLPPPGVEYDAAASRFNPKDMQFGDLSATNRREITALKGLHDSLLGITESVNRSNMQEARRTFYKDVIIPETIKIAQTITMGVLPLTDTDLAAKGLEFQFDLSGVDALNEAPGELVNAHAQLTGVVIRGKTSEISEIFGILGRTTHWCGTAPVVSVAHIR